MEEVGIELSLGQAAKFIDQAEKAGTAFDKLLDSVRAFSSLNGAADPLDDFADSLKKVEKAVQDAGRASEASAKQIAEVGKVAGESSQAGGNLSSSFDGMKLAAGAAAVAVAAVAVELGKTMVTAAADAAKATGLLQAKLGTTGEDAKKLTDSAKAIYTQGFGESLKDTSEALATTRQNFKKLNDTDLNDLTKKGLIIKETFGADMAESMKVATSMTTNFGIKGQDALDLITKGFQMGADKSGDFLDTLNEYSMQFSSMGFSAEEFTGVLVNGLENGAFGADKVGDAVKELWVRMNDGSKTTREALQGLGIDADDFAKKLGSGAMTGKQAMELINTKLRGVEDTVQQNILGVGLYGTQWEDMGPKVVLSLDKGNQALTNFKGATDEAGRALKDNFADKWENLVKTFQTKLGDMGAGIFDKLGPAIQRVIDTFSGLVEGIVKFERETGILSGLIEGLMRVFEVSMGIIKTFFDTLRKGAEAAALTLKGDLAGAWGVVSGETEKATGTMSKALMQVATNVLPPYQDAVDRAGSKTKDWARASEDVAKAAEEAKGKVDPLRSSISDITGVFGDGRTALTQLNDQIARLRTLTDEAAAAMNENKTALANLDTIVGGAAPKVRDLWKEWKDLNAQNEAGIGNHKELTAQANAVKQQMIELDPKLADITKAYGYNQSQLKDNTKAWQDNTIAASLTKQEYDALKTVTDETTTSTGRMKAAAELTTPAITTLGTTTSDASGAIDTATGDMLTALQGLQTKFGEASTTAKTEMGKVGSAVSTTDLSSAAVRMGSSLIDGLISGIKNNQGRAEAAARNAANAVSAAAGRAFRVESPSKIFEHFGEMNMEGLTVGIEDNVHKPAKAITSAMLEISKRAKDAITDQSGILQEVTFEAGKLVNDNLMQVGNRYNDVIRQVGDMSRGNIGQVSAQLDQAIQSLGSNVHDSVSGAAGEFSRAMQELADTATGHVTSVGNEFSSAIQNLGNLASGSVTGAANHFSSAAASFSAMMEGSIAKIGGSLTAASGFSMHGMPGGGGGGGQDLASWVRGLTSPVASANQIHQITNAQQTSSIINYDQRVANFNQTNHQIAPDASQDYYISRVMAGF